MNDQNTIDDEKSQKGASDFITFHCATDKNRNTNILSFGQHDEICKVRQHDLGTEAFTRVLVFSQERRKFIHLGEYFLSIVRVDVHAPIERPNVLFLEMLNAFL